MERFCECVTDAFEAVIQQYEFKVIRCDNIRVDLQNNHCILILARDYSDIEFRIIDLNEPDYEIGVPVALRQMYPDRAFDTDSVHPYETWDSILERLRLYAKHVQENFGHALLGDFSWAPQVRVYVEEMKSLHAVLWNLDAEDPAYQKWELNDETWIDDLRARLSQVT